MPHPQIITFSNQKGGVGKTTLTRELGIYLATSGHHTLLIDTDPQGNLTKGLTDEIKRGTWHAYTEGTCDLHRIRDNLCLLHGSEKLAQLERNLIGEVDAYTRLTHIVYGTMFKPFEYILIDTPPTLGVMTLNALAASHYLGIVINPAVYSLQGTNTLMETYSKVKENLNADLAILGAFVNAVDSRPVIVREIMEELKDNFADLLITPPLSRSVKIEEVIPRQAGVVELGPSKVKNEVEAIGSELIQRVSR
jgi:chromosome partitioning protein